MASYETLLLSIADGVAELTLNRPEAMNSFNAKMRQELSEVWARLRSDDEVRVVLVTGSGDRAFCTGIDRSEAMADIDTASEALDGFVSPFMFDDPGHAMCPKGNELWKPVVAAVNGIACGGAFYLLGEADVIIAAESATFFDPHVTYGMTAAFEPMQLVGRMDFGELMRMSLMGAAERLSAKRAHEVGLVSEVTKDEELLSQGRWIAATIAASPALATQGTLRSLWMARELSRQQAIDQAYLMVGMGTSKAALAEGQERFSSGQRMEWRLR
ncbi:MAG: enoyl-CoA hydratase/isomerase family protein [Actinobacteria bacterium]|nr:enoyl-CoA hydratase/isomerase family protein [Actinomycetota bacterium]